MRARLIITAVGDEVKAGHLRVVMKEGLHHGRAYSTLTSEVGDEQLFNHYGCPVMMERVG